MKTVRSDIGMIGLAVMGRNLALNIAGRGYRVAVWNRHIRHTRDFLSALTPIQGRQIDCARSMGDFVRKLARPRRVILLVKAGAPVDWVLEGLLPLLGRGDIVMDGGNSHFSDTERRQARALARGVRYLGMGISGGEFGARHGPSIMPGGDRSAYVLVRPILEKAAAETSDGPCCAYVGKSSAGHFTKMVHNGIEYAVMQVLAESWDIMATGLGMRAGEAGELFARWNNGPLSSYLVGITATVLGRKDSLTGRPLVEMIRDSAGQKGTGKWTTQAALDLGVPVPTITAAVDARIISGHQGERLLAGKNLGSSSARIRAPRGMMAAALMQAVRGAILVSYAQGLHLLARASREYGYGIRLDEVCRIWKGGCIIRSRELDMLMRSFRDNPRLEHLFGSRRFAAVLRPCAAPLRRVVERALAARIPVPALSSALAYRDSFVRERLPANLIQAQRDYFGSHTFERTDRPGVFHENWDG